MLWTFVTQTRTNVNKTEPNLSRRSYTAVQSIEAPLDEIRLTSTGQSGPGRILSDNLTSGFCGKSAKLPDIVPMNQACFAPSYTQ